MTAKREAIVVGGVNHWTCYDCKELLPESMFRIEKTKNNRVSTYCKKCLAIRQKKSYKKLGKKPITPEQKEHNRQYIKEYTARNKEHITELKRKRYQRKYIEENGIPYTPKLPRSPIEVNGVIHWNCCKCGRLLPEPMFNVKKNSNRITGECKECRKEYNKKYYDSNKDKIKQQAKEYYQAHNEQSRKRNKEWRENNKEHIQEHRRCYSKKYYATNKDKIDASHREYYHKNREERLVKTNEYAKNNRDKCLLWLNSRRNREKNVITTLTHEDWQDCLEFFGYKDAYTGLPMNKTTQDHVIPVSKGGNYTRQNIIPCDFVINCSKQDSDMEEWYRRQSYFSEKRLEKIYKWMGRNPKSESLQIALF